MKKQNSDDYNQKKYREDIERMIIANKPIKCEECGSPLYFMGGGKYKCSECDYTAMDDFGKVKDFLDENGPSPAVIICNATGVSLEIIDFFLKKGRLEIPENSPYYLNCEKCGCSIRYGRFCPVCIRQLAGGIQAIFNEDMGEKPKSATSSGKGKMHFLTKNK